MNHRKTDGGNPSKAQIAALRKTRICKAIEKDIRPDASELIMTGELKGDLHALVNVSLFKWDLALCEKMAETLPTFSLDAGLVTRIDEIRKVCANLEEADQAFTELSHDLKVNNDRAGELLGIISASMTDCADLIKKEMTPLIREIIVSTIRQAATLPELKGRKA